MKTERRLSRGFVSSNKPVKDSPAVLCIWEASGLAVKSFKLFTLDYGIGIHVIIIPQTSKGITKKIFIVRLTNEVVQSF